MPRPQFITCALCGRGFGSASINIHIPQCFEKAIKRWQLNPQGPRPVMPPLHGSAGAKVGGRSSNVSFPGKPSGGGVSAARSLQTQSMFLESEAPENMNLHPCSKCGRKFNFDRVAYHESVCKGDQKRRVFDSSKKRLAAGDGDDAYAGGAFGAPRDFRSSRKKKMGTANTTSRYAPAPTPQTNWRQQHEEFINAIRSAKRADAETHDMWGAPSAATSRGAFRTTAPGGTSAMLNSSYRNGDPSLTRSARPAQRIPPLMTKQSESRRQNITTGGRAAKAKATSGIAAPGMRFSGRPNPPPPRGDGAFGGGGDRFSYRAGGIGGSGVGRILNDNSNSLGMLQAMGRA